MTEWRCPSRLERFRTRRRESPAAPAPLDSRSLRPILPLKRPFIPRRSCLAPSLDLCPQIRTDHEYLAPMDNDGVDEDRLAYLHVFQSQGPCPQTTCRLPISRLWVCPPRLSPNSPPYPCPPPRLTSVCVSLMAHQDPLTVELHEPNVPNPPAPADGLEHRTHWNCSRPSCLESRPTAECVRFRSVPLPVSIGSVVPRTLILCRVASLFCTAQTTVHRMVLWTCLEITQCSEPLCLVFCYDFWILRTAVRRFLYSLPFSHTKTTLDRPQNLNAKVLYFSKFIECNKMCVQKFFKMTNKDISCLEHLKNNSQSSRKKMCDVSQYIFNIFQSPTGQSHWIFNVADFMLQCASDSTNIPLHLKK